MRAVVDTNVMVSATLIRGGNEDGILRAWQRGAFELVLSPAILEEIGRVFSCEKLLKARWMTEREIVLLLETLAQGSVLVPGTTSVRACRDADDDKFLAAAVEGRAQYVVSGDKDLLALKSYRRVAS
ncbi:MAG: putative toxin-antitoxin system toxin component, PIN family [Candidatus Rokubacteria bacterium]|nr:putative toxin-antitoxin system toxin component, PIN family [Candidatus Rokubacteria bacterium]